MKTLPLSDLPQTNDQLVGDYGDMLQSMFGYDVIVLRNYDTAEKHGLFKDNLLNKLIEEGILSIANYTPGSTGGIEATIELTALGFVTKAMSVQQKILAGAAYYRRDADQSATVKPAEAKPVVAAKQSAATKSVIPLAVPVIEPVADQTLDTGPLILEKRQHHNPKDNDLPVVGRQDSGDDQGHDENEAYDAHETETASLSDVPMIKVGASPNNMVTEVHLPGNRPAYTEELAGEIQTHRFLIDEESNAQRATTASGQSFEFDHEEEGQAEDDNGQPFQIPRFLKRDRQKTDQ